MSPFRLPFGQQSKDRKVLPWSPDYDKEREFDIDARGPTFERVLSGHSGGVMDLAITPDGSRVISAGKDKTIRVWDLATGNLERILTADSENEYAYVYALAVSPDGAHVVAVGPSGFEGVRVWDLATGNLERTLKGHKWVKDVTITPDGSRIVSAGAGGADPDNTIKIWDLATGNLERTLECRRDAPEIVVVSPDGKWLLSEGATNPYGSLLWDFERGAVIREIHGRGQAHGTIIFSPDSSRIIQAGGVLDIIDPEVDGVGVLRTLLAGSVEAIAITSDSRTIVAAGYQKAWVFDLNRNRLQLFRDKTDFFRVVVVTPDCRQIIVGGDIGVIKVWGI